MRRVRKTKKTKEAIIDWINQLMATDECAYGKDEDFKKAYEALLKAHYEANPGLMTGKPMPDMTRRMLKIRRKCGCIETHIIFTDDSRPATKVRINSGDEILGADLNFPLK